ncbi:Chaperone DnaJ-domain superfamily protein [Striga hermonthica]|uniref:Chaperone DnaJ-domain superfamily protein n=1 Tax=Striga hermonthica TaxID=68872 RepID=A0A9N7N5U2_STRHE|nr:Chaperone DnaJ-domain superfamily protein [Striga hermonthica]
MKLGTRPPPIPAARRSPEKSIDMDEYWRMRMGMPKMPPPPPSGYPPDHVPGRSTAADASHRRKNPISDEPLNPEDFDDVFGGPPRTVLSGRFATACQRSLSSSSSSGGFIYEEIFRQAERAPPPPDGRTGRILPEFRIPGQKGSDFYSDIFGWEDHERVVRSRSRSKASSSSVLSSEELSPLQPAAAVDGHDDVSYFASKLSRRNTSPETISLNPVSNDSFPDDFELNSLSSAVSSVSQSSDEKLKMEDGFLGYDEEDEDDDDDMSAYVIEINTENRGGRSTYESNGVDEAIAWAKEKFQTQCEMKNPAQENFNGHQESDQGHADSFGPLLDGQRDEWGPWKDKEQLESKVQNEMQILDEQLRMWSANNRANIRLLLSSLHQILWPESGWFAVSLSDLTEISQVKKAYQKARLCLHPDKLQQRGATIQQKYIADKAFSLLQEAWEAFVTQRVS